MGFALPLSSLRLLVPPLRLMSAFMWQVVQQQSLEHFNKLEEYILLITKMVPEILSNRQMTSLIMGLRAKLTLEKCRDEGAVDLDAVKECLLINKSPTMFPITGLEVEALQDRLLKLVVSLLEDPVKKEHFFQEVYPLEYGSDFDKALQVLVGHFLSRLEQLLPVPNFKQAAMWLDADSTGCEDLVEGHWDPSYLLPLLQSDIQRTLERNGLPSVVEDRIISSLSLPPVNVVVIPNERETDDRSVTHLSYVITDIIEEPVSPRYIEESLIEKDLPFLESGVETMPEVQEVETSIEADRPEQSSLMSDTLSDLKKEDDDADDDEGVDEIVDDEAATPEASSEKRLKVVVPRHMLTIAKQISLPSVLLPRYTSSDLVTHQMQPDDLNVPFSLSPDASDISNSPRRTLRMRQHRCYQCGVSFRYRVQLKAHKKRHNEKGPYKCLPCNLSFPTYFQVSAHQRKHHSKVTYSCTECKKTFKSVMALSKHSKEHKKKSVHRCADCGKECPSFRALLSHSRTHKKVVKKAQYTCTFCGHSFSQKTYFTIHMKSHRANFQRANRAKTAPPVKRPPGECRFCGQMFSEIELRSHLKTHPEFRPHQCDHCGKCFATLQALLAHISNHTGEKPHVCLHCDKKFFSKWQLKSHMRCHSKERPFCCAYCGKCFPSVGSLTIHIRKHTGEKPYVCLECGKAFSSAGCLQVHQRRHTGEKPYECNVCGRGFTVSSHRTVHMRAHTGLRPFACEICGKTFMRKSCWKEHMYRHSNLKPFPCSFCSKSFTRQGHLKRHMQSHSNVQSSVSS